MYYASFGMITAPHKSEQFQFNQKAVGRLPIFHNPVTTENMKYSLT